VSSFDERNGWKLYQHPAFREVFNRLMEDVESIKDKNPDTYQSHPKTKLLKRIIDLILVEIPSNPKAEQFRLGNTLGKSYRHWHRAKFFGRFRLFFRYSSSHKAIVYAWMNDENTLRKAGAKSDPYAVFVKGLGKGNPPDDWDKLGGEC